MASQDTGAATKKLAQQGQWKTPPLPVFASAPPPPSTEAATTTTTSTSNLPLPTALPATPDDFARMLQEAYKRGAEAAAMAQIKTEDPSSHPPTTSNDYHQQQQQQRQQQYAQKSVSDMQANAAANYNFPLLQPSSSSVVTNPHSVRPVMMGHQSVSMPDISSYHKKEEEAAAASEEEEKRKKRLARNRASARARRLKKKNLVESYEGEVGILEAALTKLRNHTWSTDDDDNNNHDALIEALSMDRGQQPLTSQSRRELIRSIVTQQKEQVENLLECQLENWILGSLAASPNSHDDEYTSELTSELQSILELTPQQLSDIQHASTGTFREIRDLNTVSSCLDAILSNEWLLDDGVDDIASQFHGILNPSQMSKFLLWADHNSDAIDKLDYVNVGAGAEKNAVFEFGVDEGMMEGGD